MKTVSARLPDDEAERFERIVLMKRLQGEDISRSGVVRDLVREWIEDHEHVLEDRDV